MMINTYYSVTERYLLNPILTMRAPLAPEHSDSIGANLWQIVESELIARVAAIFTSVLAAADFTLHLSMSCFEGLSLLTRVSSDYSKLCLHLRQATFFAGLTLFGSALCTFNPDLLKKFRFCPAVPSGNIDFAPKTVKNLASTVQNGTILHPFDLLKEEWSNLSLEEKSWFVQVFNQDGIESYAKIRRELSPNVYKPIHRSRRNLVPIKPIQNRQVQWQSNQETDLKMANIWHRTQVCNKAFYYHATSEKSLQAILRSKKIEVRHEKVFNGAFVSTKPETSFGNCIFALNRNIERLSPLTHGFNSSDETYWAGFSKDIPINDSTLEYIIYNGFDHQELQRIQGICQEATSRTIPVFCLSDVENSLEQIKNLHTGIPREWPGESDNTNLGNYIIQTFQHRANVENQIASRLRASALSQTRQAMQYAYS